MAEEGFGTIKDELRQNRLEQRKGNVLAEKLLAEKRLDDTAKQIVADALPEIGAEALYSGKLIDVQKKLDKEDLTDKRIVLQSRILQQTFLLHGKFYREILGLMNKSEIFSPRGAGRFNRPVKDNVISNFSKQIGETNKTLNNQLKAIDKQSDVFALNRERFLPENAEPNDKTGLTATLEKSFGKLGKAFGFIVNNNIGTVIFNVMKKSFTFITKKIAGLFGGVFGKVFGFLKGLVSSVFGLVKDTLGFLLKPFKLIFNNASRIFNTILTLVLLGALIDFLKSPLFQDGKKSIAEKINTGLKFVSEGYDKAVELLMKGLNALKDFIVDDVIPIMKKVIFGFLDNRVVRFFLPEYGADLERRIDEALVQSKIRDLEKQIEKSESMTREERIAARKSGNFIAEPNVLRREQARIAGIEPVNVAFERKIDRLLESNYMGAGGSANIFNNTATNTKNENHMHSGRNISPYIDSFYRRIIDSGN